MEILYVENKDFFVVQVKSDLELTDKKLKEMKEVFKTDNIVLISELDSRLHTDKPELANKISISNNSIGTVWKKKIIL